MGGAQRGRGRGGDGKRTEGKNIGKGDEKGSINRAEGRGVGGVGGMI